MYSVTVRRSFIAQHYLTVPNPGPEGDLHSHEFTVEVELAGPELNDYGYLVDIDAVKGGMDAVVDDYRDATLNETPAFEGLNPSVEHFSRIFCEAFLAAAEPANPTRVTVRMFEDGEAWAAYERPLDPDARADGTDAVTGPRTGSGSGSGGDGGNANGNANGGGRA
jgi:6-pyruvoyltetrahydropterin/6-carboxytetrahydropterin synthase